MDKSSGAEPILVSACLLGETCRFDAQSKEYPGLKEALAEYEIVPFCPECSGGLSTPRLPAERKGDRVIRKDGKDVTKEFVTGAEKALRVCKERGIKKALLKSKSPSCGVEEIYDGSFSGQLIKAQGMTAELLEGAGIEILDENKFMKG